MAIKKVPREEEPVEFRLMPGQEDEWAGASELELSGTWYWLGFFPVCTWILFVLIMIGAS